VIELTREDIENAIASGVNKAIDTKTKDFYVERETHWKHHEALGEFIDFFVLAKKTAWRTFVGFIVLTILSLIGLGMWGKFN
jgi:hypothetical protein